MSLPSLPVGIGSLLAFDYPLANRLGLPLAYLTRRIVVTDVRDVLRRPLTPAAVELVPLVRRGRWLITGYDLDRRAERSFYWEAMRHVARPSWLTLGLWDPLDAPDAPPRCTRGVFAPALSERLFLADVLRRYRLLSAGRPDVHLVAGVFPLLTGDAA